ncbi:cucumber peeling cupredoxin-like [Olea europaea var. sylvestris]|uniref:cucumber peeling cupredoxin-like n=1 Tax=Olea europaea var. sylvestris TaxID=158386 RepID=UPI000C1CD131|nr:cucumber peeling cupredoxin-like [Olea europaea var. sylvestris]
MGRNIKFVIVFAVLVGICAVVEKGDAATYIVGDSLGWTIPPGGASAYTSWASQHVFRTGDVLVFNFSTGIHDVARVTKAAFDNCSPSNPTSLITVGPANVTLDSPGEAHFICTFGQHCANGQKLAINVSAASSPAPSPTPPAPAPAPGITPPAVPVPAPAPRISPPGVPVPAPAPAPTPNITPPGAPAPGPTPTGGTSPPPSPESTPAPPPGEGATPPSPPAPPGASPPGSSPPPPNSAPTSTIATSFVIFASIAIWIAI